MSGEGEGRRPWPRSWPPGWTKTRRRRTQPRPGVTLDDWQYVNLCLLRWTEAGRAILAVHRPCANNGHTWCGADHEEWPCRTVGHLAAVYSDHPGYRPEWKL
jgi:hypothetical protein